MPCPPAALPGGFHSKASRSHGRDSVASLLVVTASPVFRKLNHAALSKQNQPALIHHLLVWDFCLRVHGPQLHYDPAVQNDTLAPPRAQSWREAGGFYLGSNQRFTFGGQKSKFLSLSLLPS